MHLPANLTVAATVPTNSVQSPHWECWVLCPSGSLASTGVSGGNEEEGPVGWLEKFPDPLHLYLAPSFTCEWNPETANPPFLLGKILFS